MQNEVPRLNLDRTAVLWEMERSASGLEGGPFRAVLLNLGLLERRQIPAGEARGLRSGLLRRAAAVGGRAKTPLEFPVSIAWTNVDKRSVEV